VRLALIAQRVQSISWPGDAPVVECYRDKELDMQLSEVMSSTASNYGAKYYPFTQADYGSWMPKGMCHALCRVFLRRTHVQKKLYVEEFKHWTSNNELNLAVKQTKAGIRQYQSTHLSDKRTESVFEYESRNLFWEAVGDLLEPVQQWDNYLCTMVSTKQTDHVVATCIRNEYDVFFEPNGGILKFKEGRMAEWIGTELPNADGYDHVQGIDRETFDVRDGKSFGVEAEKTRQRFIAKFQDAR